ncbi:hypothetical protein Y001_12005 [Staphylococcus aureus MUF256]|nr:hypothetical protein Y001_12005 [Staphylococcus aureus MUF256]
MTTKENIDTLRKPGAQALSLISLFLILFSCLTFFFGLDYERFPNYLKITTIIELIIIVISLLQWIRFIDFEKESTQKYKKNICSIFSYYKCVNYYHCSICTV